MKWRADSLGDSQELDSLSTCSHVTLAVQTMVQSLEGHRMENKLSLSLRGLTSI